MPDQTLPQKEKILIVEDDTYTRDIYQEIFTDAGYDVTIAVNGEEGLTKARQGGYAIILLDIIMPVKNGIEVLKGLEAAPPIAPNGPVVILTNLVNDPLMKDALNLGASSYIVKSSLNPDQLLFKVKEMLKPAQP